MKSLQILDCDYVFVNDKPLVRLFGKTDGGKSVCAFYQGIYPYFYAIPSKTVDEVRVFLEKNFKADLSRIYETEKFLPIGYHKDKTKMVKIFLKNPANVPAVRDSLLTNKIVEKVFEADILFKYRFMADTDISGMKWYDIEDAPASTNQLNVDEVVEIKKIQESQKRGNMPFKILSIDIETISNKEDTAVDFKNDSIIMISLTFEPEFNKHKSLVLVSRPLQYNDDVLSFRDEKTMLQEFIKIVTIFDPDFLIGYNIDNFDMPFIIERMKSFNITPLIGRCKDKAAYLVRIGPDYKATIPGRVVADVYKLIKSGAIGLARMKRYGLGDVSQEILKESKVDVAHSEIARFWNGTSENLLKLISYARKDSYLAMKLFLEGKMIDNFIELCRTSGILLQDALDGGESVRIEQLLLKEFNREDYVIPIRPTEAEVSIRSAEREKKGLEGGFVLDPVVGLSKDIVYLDFKSMYPSIIISYNICPITLDIDKNQENTLTTPNGIKFVSKDVKHGIFPRILEYLITERDHVRKLMKTTDDPDLKRSLDARQWAMKIMANAFYGYTGYFKAKLYVVDIASAVTASGRFLIKKTRDVVEKDPSFKVIYGDTDSIMVKVPTNDIEAAYKLSSGLEEKINMALDGVVKIKLESIFKSILIMAKKRYAGVSLEKHGDEWKEKIVMKGIETIRRDWCDLTSESLLNVLKMILSEEDPKKALLYMRGVINDLKSNKIPIEKLVITKSMSKSMGSYKGVQPHIEVVKKMRKRDPYGAPGMGDRIGYVIIRGKEMMSERAEDPEYVKAHKLLIDPKYYIENQILPPIERVFESIGIQKSEIVGKGRQLALNSLIPQKL